MGYDVAIPALPTHLVATEAPLRAAIQAWIASTGAVVPPDELATQLARADALPLPVQRDIALLLLSTIEASTLQRAALSRLTPADLRWIQEHPEVAEQLVQGIDTPETRRMAYLSGFVDMPQSIAATLLVLQAVEATRGSLADPEAQRALQLADTATLDPAARAVLQVLAHADAAASDVEKVRLAAKLVALGAGIDVPEPRAAPTFEAALQRLVLATGEVIPAEHLAPVLERANALPDDLELAIARLLEAEAIAIEAASPAGITATSQNEALAAMLIATAEALPVLEKYNLYWRAAPAALRVSEWDPAARAGWAAHHTALVVSARNDLVDLVQTAELVNGRDLVSVPAIPQRSFLEAYEAVAIAGGFPVDDATRVQLQSAADSLSPAVRDAAALLMSGAAESARLRAEAFAALSDEEQQFLALETAGIDALYEAPALTQEQLDKLERATGLAERVDARKLALANAVAALAMSEAQRMLSTETTLRTQGSDATLVKTGLAGLLARLSPIGSARAQATGCNAVVVEVNCENDVVLRLRYPPVNGMTPGELVASTKMPGANESGGLFLGPVVVSTGGQGWTCDERECVVYGFTQTSDDGMMFESFGGQANDVMLVITGQGGFSYQPELTERLICASIADGYWGYKPAQPCRKEQVPRYGAPAISIDLGGDDTYIEARAMVAINATIPVSFHLDMGGNDVYTDPTQLYDTHSPLISALGSAAGHPSQASAMFGGAAVLVDVAGNDVYEAPTRSQGFGRLGIGLLADLAGIDVFAGRDGVQGASSDTFTLGAGILFNVNGADEYTARSGQGFGLGGIFLDVNGDDRYINDDDANGIPVVQLDVLPGGDITAFDRREDNLAWLDGAGSLNVGIGVDQEVVITAGGSDSDGIPDFVEFAFGTDPYDSRDSPITNPTARATALLDDGDGDGYPSYIERALSTDPADATSYPAGLPAGVDLVIPAPIMGVVNTVPLEPGQAVGIDEEGNVNTAEAVNGTAETNFTGSDKIVDLRLPLQRAGSIEYACTGVYYMNATSPVPGLFAPGNNTFNDLLLSGLTGEGNPNTGGPATDADGKTAEQCTYVSYQSAGGGQGNGTLPTSAKGERFDFTFPAGILAIGDVVNTAYADDYFVVIDLGGNDRFTNGAGGAIPVLIRPTANGETTSNGNVNQTFLAPSLVVNVDLETATQGTVSTGIGRDLYISPGRDFVQGAFFGLLLDTDGSDVYLARDGSQGSLGGALLDLGGLFDSYTARHLSQGAGLAHQAPSGANTRPTNDLPEGGNMTADRLQGQKLTARRAFPGLLLDLTAAGGNMFTAGAHSQGFARGYTATAPLDNTAPALGILASVSPSETPAPDLYKATGRYSQGVGGNDGVGLLVDTAGADRYYATGLISQGATISQAVGTQLPDASANPHPATGVLADLGGGDEYYYSLGSTQKQRTNERGDTTTITRSETVQTAQTAYQLYADVGVHIDWQLDPNDPVGFLSTLGGSGEGGAIDESGKLGFHVDLPTARLAIGSNFTTTYTNEYAFVVDLGGDNAYMMNAGGHVRDYLARRNATAESASGIEPGSSVYAAPLNMFPVSVLVDAGAGNSTYTSTSTFTQGAGFFGVGVLADLGGRDVLRALPENVTGRRSEWIDAQPIIDATIGSDWEGVDARDITLVAQRDPRFDSTWQMRVANDEGSLYLALRGKTMSTEPADRFRDTLTVHFDMANRHEAWNTSMNRTGIDSVKFTFDQNGACVPLDRTVRNLSATSPYYILYGDDARDWTSTDVIPRFQAACSTSETGEVVFEMRKNLTTRTPLDNQDLSYCYQPGVGFGRDVTTAEDCLFPANEIGVYIEFNDSGAGYYHGADSSATAPASASPFSWPLGAVQYDGEGGFRRDGNLSEEMSRWAAIGLARDGQDGAIPALTSPPSFSHGAAIAGVGVLAMLGSGASDALLASGDRALGYGAYQGLGLLVDAGGSDLYVGRDLVLGASENLGAGVAIDLEGNDNYRAQSGKLTRSLGYSPADTATAGSALFLDLGGDDEYAWIGQLTQKIDQLRSAGQSSGTPLVPPREGNNIAWAQNSGIGADYRLRDIVSETISGLVANSLFGTTRTTLSFTKVGSDGKCTDKPLDPTAGKPAARGPVCFHALVEVGQGPVPRQARTQLDTLRGLAGEDSALEAQFDEMERLLGSGTFGGAIDVAAVDFLVDRARVATTFEAVKVTNTSSLWTAQVDLSGSEDGLARVKAIPIFTAAMPSGDVLVFQDGNDVTNYLTDGPNHRTIFVDNVPGVSAGVSPPYTGIANATYSPYAAGDLHSLNVTWTVTPDALESRLAAYNGWAPQPTNRSIPCEGIPDATARPTLCHNLPFFLGKNGNELTTEPGDFPVADARNIVIEMLDGNPFTASTAPTKDAFQIMKEESFHLTIPNRAPLVQTGSFATEVVLTLEGPDGIVKDQDGNEWRLGYARQLVPAGAVNTDSVLPILGQAGDIVDQQLQNVSNTVDRTLAGNVVWNTVNTTYGLGPLCGNQNTQCDQLTGYYGTGQLRGCKADRKNTIVWDAFKALDTNVYLVTGNSALPAPVGGTRPCEGAYDIVNRTAEFAGSGTSGAFDDAGEGASGALDTVTGLAGGDDGEGDPGEPGTPSSENVRNFQEVYFDVNAEEPHADFVAKGVRFVGDRLNIPAGYKIRLEFSLKTDGSAGTGIEEAWVSLFGEIDAAVAEQYPHGTDPLLDTIYENNIDFTLNQQQNENASVGNNVDSLAQGGRVVPAAYFIVKSEDPESQPRLEVRVPADATTTVDVTLDTPEGDVAATLLGGEALVGDRDHPAAPHRASGDIEEAWNANESDHVLWTVEKNDGVAPRWTVYNTSFADPSVPDGLYRLTVTAKDKAEQVGKYVHPVILDQTAPVTAITTNAYVGDAVLHNNAIPVRWLTAETGSGIREVYVYARNGVEGDISAGWTRLGPFGPSEAVTKWAAEPQFNKFLFMSVGIDRAGNVEGTQNAANLAEALDAAFAAKLGMGRGAGYTEVFVDQNDPRFLSVGTVGGRLLNYQGGDYTFVRAGEPIRFQVCVSDAETDIGGVKLELFPIDPRHQSRAKVYDAALTGSCANGARQYSSSEWPTENTRSDLFPEGIWRVQMQVFDKAGNTIRVGAGAVILDHSSPTVTLEDPVLPTGQSAVKPGDLVKVRLLAADDWGVDEGGITVDASAFAANASALKTRPVRVNGIIYQEATFTVDKPDLQNGVFEIVVKVPDLAGNATVVKKALAVNFRPFEFVPGSLHVTNVTHNSLELRWQTDENTSALAKFGTTAVALSGRTPQDLNATKDHVLKVEGLAASTRYYLRAVSISTGGFTKESEVIEAETLTALFLNATSPRAGDAVSGAVPIKFKGGLLDSESFVTYTLEVRDDPLKAWTFVTTATRQGEEHTLFWNSTRFLDGRTYELRLTAEAGRDVARVTLGPLTSDNTPPSVLVLAPLIATNDTTPSLNAEAGDALSGFGATPAKLLVDGVPSNATLRVAKDGDRLRITHEALADLAPGLRTLELQVADAAGNVAKETWKVAIDGDAPNVTVNPTRFAPGTAAARQDGTVTLNVTIKDLSGVSTAVADTSNIATQPETRLVKLVNTDNWQGTFTVADISPSATHQIALRATDLAGNIRTVTIPVVVDNVEPSIRQTAMGAIGHTRAEVEVPADEPILVSGTATAPASPPVSASTTTAAATAKLVFDGLLPSRTYRFELLATDLAGNPVELAGSFATERDLKAPSDLGDLSVTDLLNGTLRISWPAATDDVAVAGYRVYRSEDGGVTFPLVAEVIGTSFEDRGLPYEKPYVYRVAAIDYGSNEGKPSTPLKAAATAVPSLSGGVATPTVGTTATVFRYTITYLSPGGVTPAYVRVIIDGVPQNMTLESGDAQTGAIYVYETRLAPHTRDAPHTYAFETSDGRYTVKFPQDGSVLRGPLVSSDALAGEDVGRLASFAQRVPLGGVASLALAMVAAVAITAMLRKKKEGSK